MLISDKQFGIWGNIGTSDALFFILNNNKGLNNDISDRYVPS